MRLVCLVHGSTQNASGWALLVPELQRRGHRAICVNRTTDEPEASATRYAQGVAEALRHSTGAPIVVAHFARLLNVSATLTDERTTSRRLCGPVSGQQTQNRRETRFLLAPLSGRAGTSAPRTRRYEIPHFRHTDRSRAATPRAVARRILCLQIPVLGICNRHRLAWHARRI